MTQTAREPTTADAPASAIFRAEIDAIVRRFGTGWEALRGARLFVTGGTGYFGRWLLPTLARADETLGLDLAAVVLSRSPERFLEHQPALAASPAIRFQRGDVRDFAFPAGEFTHVIHAAATSAEATFQRAEDPLTKFDTTLEGTRRALDFARERGIARLLMVSSGSYYGALDAQYDAFPESYPVAPAPTDLDAAIGHAKRAAEFLCAAYAQRGGPSYSVARCFSFVGPWLPLDLHYAIGNFIRDALLHEAIIVAGDGQPVRSYLYAGDLIVWLLTLLTRGEAGRAYNVGSDEAIAIGDLARKVAAVVSPGKEVRVLGQANGTATRNVYVPDIGRARKELALVPWTSLERAIELTARVARESRNWGEA